MSVIKRNLVTQGLSGKLGGMLVFRRVGTETVVATTPASSTKGPSADQQNRRERFQLAVTYAKAQLSDPGMKAAYAALIKGRPFITAYNLAMADFMNPPVIVEMDFTAYTGAVNDVIRVRATDDFRVAGVTVEIHDHNNALLESGPATQMANGIDWSYKATAANSTVQGSKVVVKAKDLPGNETTAEQTL